jgi:hypothetical protein
MQINISPGEALDRLTILDIKEREIKDATKLTHIQNEKKLYEPIQVICSKYSTLYTLLTFVNKRIWDKTDIIKTLTPSDPSFAMIAHEIFELNQQRFRLKSAINRMTGASIHEQKSYAESTLVLHYTIIDTSAAVDIVYYFLHYDTIYIQTHSTHPILRLLGVQMPPTPHNSFDAPPINRNTEYYTALCEMFKPISYVSGGLLGDFVHQLSVICENYYTTGRKGNLYITNAVGDPFRFGVEKAYNDLMPLLCKQEYIETFKLHAGETGINLSAWRGSPLLCRASWYHIFQQSFQVEFGKHQWLQTNTMRKEFEGKTVISTSCRRLHPKYDIQVDISNSIFVSFDKESYDHFVSLTNIKIPLYICDSLTEMVDIIHSCSVFIGNLSSPLAFAYALHKKSVVLKSKSSDDIHIHNLSHFLPYITIL